MKKIIHTVDIKAPKEKVYDAITKEEGLSGWWTTRVRKDGETISFTFAEDFNPVMKVTHEDKEKVSWEIVSGHDKWDGSRFTFSLEERDNSTVVLFVHEYGKELEDEYYGRYNYNWGYYLDSMRLYCENGKGKPFSAQSD